MKRLFIILINLVTIHSLYANLIAIKNDEGVEFVRVSEINNIIKTNQNIVYPIEYGLYSQFKNKPYYLKIENKILLEKTAEEKRIIDLPVSDRYVSNSIWYEFPLATNIVVTTNIISDTYIKIANRYKKLLVSYFGAGAETNQVITEDYVVLYFEVMEDASNKEVRDGNLLKTRFEILKKTGFCQNTNETWTFPYDKTNIVKSITNIIHVCD